MIVQSQKGGGGGKQRDDKNVHGKRPNDAAAGADAKQRGCFISGSDHYARDCPKKDGAVRMAASGSDEPSPGTVAAVADDDWEGDGWIMTVRTPDPGAVRAVRDPTVKSLLIDSGADDHFMRTGVAPNARMDPCSRNLVDAQGEPLSVSGESPVPVTLGGDKVAARPTFVRSDSVEDDGFSMGKL